MIWSFIRKAFKIKKRSNFWGVDSEKNPGVKVLRGIVSCIMMKFCCLGILIFLGAITVIIIVAVPAAMIEKTTKFFGL